MDGRSLVKVDILGEVHGGDQDGEAGADPGEVIEKVFFVNKRQSAWAPVHVVKSVRGIYGFVMTLNPVYDR